MNDQQINRLKTELRVAKNRIKRLESGEDPVSEEEKSIVTDDMVSVLDARNECLKAENALLKARLEEMFHPNEDSPGADEEG